MNKETKYLFGSHVEFKKDEFFRVIGFPGLCGGRCVHLSSVDLLQRVETECMDNISNLLFGKYRVNICHLTFDSMSEKDEKKLYMRGFTKLSNKTFIKARTRK